MEGYIIDPMWFYWLQALTSARTFLFILVVILAMIAAWYVFMAIDEPFDIACENAKKARKSITVAAVVLIVGLMVPSQETMIRMKLAEYATYENAEAVIREITGMADHIIEELKED